MRGIEPLSKHCKVIIVVLYAYLISTRNITLLFIQSQSKKWDWTLFLWETESVNKPVLVFSKPQAGRGD